MNGDKKQAQAKAQDSAKENFTADGRGMAKQR